MSVWTHVNGSIRIDSLRMISMGNMVSSKEDIKKRAGRIVEYDDENYETTVPLGSEGSLKYTIWEDPHESSMAAFTLNIFGDLRDYKDREPIIEWIGDITKDQFIRSGIVEISIEGSGRWIMHYDIELQSWKIKPVEE